MSEWLDGGCFCGAIRFRARGVPTDVNHCHCRMCQRSSGAGFLTWATMPVDALTISGAPAWYRSSEGARRGFCSSCGTQLFFAMDAGETIDVTVAAFDEPDLMTPTRNTWVGSRRRWVHGFDDALPDFEDEGPAPEAG